MSPDMALPHPALHIAGATATGKSAAALWLAGELGGEIVSVDSMQVYRGMDIGTAKPDAAERARIPHHLIDVAPLNEGFDAARFCRMAAQAIADIRSRGRLPILCGGTGLYFKAWLEGLGEAPAADPELRSRLETVPLEDLVEELRRTDPGTWSIIDRRNPRRVIRAVEVIRLTGRPFSAQRSAWKRPSPSQDAGARPDFFHLTRDPSDLDGRIQRRVETMFQAGWVEEVRGLLGEGLEGNPSAMQAIGYRQIVAWLREGGKAEGLASLQEEVRVRTRQYARRQGLWFRRQAKAVPLALAPGESAEQTGRRILEAMR